MHAFKKQVIITETISSQVANSGPCSNFSTKSTFKLSNNAFFSTGIVIIIIDIEFKQ